jgi:hypothetical protein
MSDLPHDIVEFLSRRTACLERIAACNATPERSDNFANEMAALRCDEIAGDQIALRRRYADEPHIVEALDHTWVKVVQRVPVQPDTVSTLIALVDAVEQALGIGTDRSAYDNLLRAITDIKRAKGAVEEASYSALLRVLEQLRTAQEFLND